MKEGWMYKKLGEIATYVNGFAFKPSDWKENGKPIIRIQNLTGNQKYYNKCCRTDIPTKFNVKRGDILISWSATLGVYEWKSEDAYLNQHIFKVVFDKGEINKRYFKYVIQMSIDEMSKHTNGATMKHIRKGDFDNIIVPIPSLSEQQQIVDRLDSAFAKIDAVKANAEKQLSDAKALFQKELSKALTPKEGWERKKLGEVCRVINGRAYSKEEMLDKGKYRLLRVGNFFTNDTWYYSDLELDEDKYCDNGDLLYAWSASFGPRIWDGEKVIYHYHIWKMVCSEDVDKRYMFYWLDSNELKKQALINLHGATMAHITKVVIENCIVGFSSLSEQQAIVTHLDTLSEKLKTVEEKQKAIMVECDAMKQALLREVFE